MTEWAALESWVQRTFGSSTVEHWLTQRVCVLLDKTQQTSAPVHLEASFAPRAVARWYYDEDVGGDAKLSIQDDRFVIKLRRNSRRLRARFSIAHELGHTEFYDVSETPPRRLTPWPVPNRAEERACNSYAAELLMPKDFVLRELPRGASEAVGLGPSEILSVLPALARKFQVSTEVAARRLIEDVGASNTLLLGCRFMPADGFRAAPGPASAAWRLCWSAVPASLANRLFVPRKQHGHRVFPSIGQALLVEYDTARPNGIDVRRLSRSKLRIGNLPTALKQLGQPETVEVFVARTGEDLSLFFDDSEAASVSFGRRREIILGVPLGHY